MHLDLDVLRLAIIYAEYAQKLVRDLYTIMSVENRISLPDIKGAIVKFSCHPSANHQPVSHRAFHGAQNHCLFDT